MSIKKLIQSSKKFHNSEVKTLNSQYLLDFDQLYFVVPGFILMSKLQYAPDQPCDGWSITFDDNNQKVKFSRIKDSIEISHSHLDNGEFSLYNSNGILLNQSISKNSFFPAIPIQSPSGNPTTPLGMYFLNYGELNAAASQNAINFDSFTFSLGSFNVIQYYQITGDNNISIPIMKIEIDFSTIIIPNSTNPMPRILLAPPCPPMWKPGYSIGNPAS